VGPGLASSGVTLRNPQRDADLSILWETWNALNEQYIDPSRLQVTPLIYGAAEGLVRGVDDPYTVFMTPEQDKNFRDELAGNLEGIGAELTMKDAFVTIVTPLKGSPAEKAGLLPKDIIIAVDGQNTEDWSLSQVVSKIRGPQGTTVKVTVFRDKVGRKEFAITRDAIHIPSVEVRTIQGAGKTFGYIALNQFGDRSISEFTRELQILLKKNIDGFVLDLRNNGGGLLDGAVDLVSLFLDQGTVVSVERRGQITDTQSVHGNPIAPKLPLVVLQNGATASAAEITAGALQDHKRATIVGEKSFGKGTVQEIIHLSGGASLRVTIAHWLTPNGKNLGKEGVTPDVVVAGTGSVRSNQKDPQLEAAIQILLKLKK
jgi:carboxyl-terminal processing protease